jgi:hypothetical protein
MELINATAVPARILTGALLAPENRIGTITAKATFRISNGRADLDTQDPYPLFDDDHETEFGLLPNDLLPRRDQVFEVLVLGAAYAPGGASVAQSRVDVAVGSERRALAVFGTRVWEPGGSPTEMSAPLQFTRMPLTASNAYGGRTLLEVDREAYLEVSELDNPDGKGFDPEPFAQGLAQVMGCPDGYPRYDRRRELPNVERDGERIATRDDKPMPAFWSAIPMDFGIHGKRSVGREALERGELDIREDVFHRAHPDWIIERPERAAKVVMEGVSPRGPMSFALPEIRVLADYVTGGRRGVIELEPHLLALLPEEERGYLVYRHAFEFDYEPFERSMRLRIEAGWRSRGAATGLDPW